MRDLRSLLADVRDCVGFFTRLPVASSSVADRAFAPTLWAAPIAGLLVAAIGALVMAISAGLQLPPAICALLAIAATMAATGALHEDGLSDSVDGLYGGFSPARRLEIMHDSRIGTFGAAALVFSIALRAAALTAIGPNWDAAMALVAAHMASRALLSAFMNMVPPARPKGLSASVGAVPRETAVVALAIGAVSLLLLGPLVALAVAPVLALQFIWVRAQALDRIGGQTGDILGALQQLAEISILCAAAGAFA